jgi:hypothetical protein
MVAGERFDGHKGYVWVYRVASPTPFLMLRAERIHLDGRRAMSPPVAFELFLPPGQAGLEVHWPDGGLAYVYLPTQVTSAPSEPGCWRVTVLDGTAPDAVVMWVRPKPSR